MCTVRDGEFVLYRCLKLPTESYEKRLLLVEKLKELQG